MPNPGRPYLQGIRDVLPMLLGVLPFGLITGVTAVGVGVKPIDATVMSVLMYAGASQLSVLALLQDGAAVAVMVLTATLINLRHIMYSASLAPWLKPLRATTRAAMSAVMVDQVYAFSLLRYRRQPDLTPNQRRNYYLGVATPLIIGWPGSTAVGAFLGAQVPPSWQLDYAIPLVFLALLAPAVTDRPSLLAAVIGGTLAWALQGLPYNLGLVVAATAGIAAGALAETQVSKKAQA